MSDRDIDLLLGQRISEVIGLFRHITEALLQIVIFRKNQPLLWPMMLGVNLHETLSRLETVRTQK